VSEQKHNSTLSSLLRIASSWPIDSDYTFERATVAHAREVAAYHSRNEEHLRPWDLSWNHARTEVEWQSQQLEASNLAWIEAVKKGTQARTLSLHLAWSWIIRRQTHVRSAHSPTDIHSTDSPSMPVLGWVEWILRAQLPDDGLTINLSYSIDQEHQGRGVMLKALSSSLIVLEASLPNARMLANVREDNKRSRALLSRLEFEDQGVDQSFPASHANGHWLRHHHYIRHFRPVSDDAGAQETPPTNTRQPQRPM